MQYANNITLLFPDAPTNRAQRTTAAPDDYNKSMNDMPWSETARSKVEQCLKHYLANAGNPFRELAFKLRALPVMYGPGGLSFVATDGRVLVVDANDEIVPFADPQWNERVRQATANKYPALAAMFPQRA